MGSGKGFALGLGLRQLFAIRGAHRGTKNSQTTFFGLFFIKVVHHASVSKMQNLPDY